MTILIQIVSVHFVSNCTVNGLVLLIHLCTLVLYIKISTLLSAYIFYIALLYYCNHDAHLICFLAFSFSCTLPFLIYFLFYLLILFPWWSHGSAIILPSYGVHDNIILPHLYMFIVEKHRYHYHYVYHKPII